MNSKINLNFIQTETAPLTLGAGLKTWYDNGTVFLFNPGVVRD